MGVAAMAELMGFGAGLPDSKSLMSDFSSRVTLGNLLNLPGLPVSHLSNWLRMVCHLQEN